MAVDRSLGVFIYYYEHWSHHSSSDKSLDHNIKRATFLIEFLVKNLLDYKCKFQAN